MILTVNTHVASGIVPFARRFLPGSRLRTYQIVVVIWVVGMCAVLFIRQGSRRWSAAVALIVLAVIALAASCGGGSAGPPPNPGNAGRELRRSDGNGHDFRRNAVSQQFERQRAIVGFSTA